VRVAFALVVVAVVGCAGRQRPSRDAIMPLPGERVAANDLVPVAWPTVDDLVPINVAPVSLDANALVPVSWSAPVDPDALIAIRWPD
jgi:hypothetical protein